MMLAGWRTSKGSWLQAAQLLQHGVSCEGSRPGSLALDFSVDDMHFLASTLHKGLQKDPRALDSGGGPVEC